MIGRHLIVVAAAALLCGASSASAQGPARKAPPAPAVDAAARSALSKLAFDGKPSTLVACTGGQFYTTHALGFTVARTRIRIDIVAGDNIDPIASVVVLQMGPAAPDGARAAQAFDDDSGGGRDPRLEITTEFDGNVVLSVGSYDGTFGCYVAKVEITIP